MLILLTPPSLHKKPSDITPFYHKDETVSIY